MKIYVDHKPESCGKCPFYGDTYNKLAHNYGVEGCLVLQIRVDGEDLLIDCPLAELPSTGERESS